MAPSIPGRPEMRLAAVEDIDAPREEWCALAERVGNLFATWEWHSTWWRHFGAGKRLLTTACRDGDGRLVAILPLYQAASRPAQVIRFIGSEQGDRLGPICEAADRQWVATGFRTAMANRRWGAGLFIGEQLPADERWGTLLGARRLSHESSPILHLEAQSWAAFLAGCSGSLRKQIRYQERRLGRDHEVQYRLVDEAGLSGALDVLFSLHGARWGKKQTPAYAGAQAFHREFAAVALARGWLRMWILELDGQPAAIWHGFRFGDADWHYQSGRDPAWDAYSVGAVLLAHTIRDSFDSGMSSYQFLRGGEAYKQRFADADPGLETIALGIGPFGRAAALAASAVRRLPSGPRQLIRSAIR